MSFAFGVRHPCDQHRSQRESAPCERRRQRWVLVTSVLGSSLAFVEGSIVNLALPSMQDDLGLDSVDLQWIVNAYLLTLSALLLVGGSAGDRFGLRRVFVVGLLLFGFASSLCAALSSPPLLIAFRALQGVGASLLVPTSLALINVHFNKADRGRAIGVWAGASALTSAIGPLLGGGLVDAFGWRSVFWAILPFAMFAAIIASRRVPERRAASTKPLDWSGAALFTVSLALLTYGLVEIESNTAIWPLLLVGFAAFGAFLYHEQRVAAPMLPLQLFGSAAFTGANLVTVLLYFALGGALFFVPFNLIQVQGFSAMQAGAAFLPLTLLLGLGSVAAGDQMKRRSPRMLLSAGAFLTGTGMWLLIIPSTSSIYLTHWFPGILVIGIGMTLSVAPLTTVVMGSASDEQSGTASGINNTAARLAGLLAIALLTAIAVQLFRRELGALLALADLPDPLQTQILERAHSLAALDVPDDARPGVAQPLVAEAYVSVFRWLMALCGAFAFAAAAVARMTVPKSSNRE